MSFWRRLFGREEEKEQTRNVNDEEQSTKSRRALLSLSTAVVGALVGAVLKPGETNAHPVDPKVLHIGHNNMATSGTQLTSAATIPTLTVANTATGLAVLAQGGRVGMSGSTVSAPIPGELVAGVHGIAPHAIGVFGHSVEQVGVIGQTDGNPLPGEPVPVGVHGIAPHGNGVFGHSFERVGVGGRTDGNPLPGEPVAGVHGVAPNAVGVLGFSHNGVGVQAISPDGLALDVVGDAHFSGIVTISEVSLPVKTGVIPLSRRRAVVNDASVGLHSLVLVSLTSNPGQGISLSWVEVRAGSFVIYLSDRVAQNTNFRYSVLG